MKCPSCNHEFDPQDTFFRECFDYITNKFPRLMIGNTSLIHQWKESGYSFDKHVKPAVDCIKADKLPTYAYIHAIIQNNIKPCSKPSEKVISTNPDADRARSIAARYKYSGFLTDSDESWLKKYELEFGVAK